MSALSDALVELWPEFDQLIETRSVGGGCISQAERVSVRDRAGERHTLFVKSNSPEFHDNFAAEWDGLSRLAETRTIRVPEPVAVGTVGGRAWLVMRWIESARTGGAFFDAFGRDLAAMHRASRGRRIGLDRDNYLGSARQVNTPSESWAEFVAEHRIGFQLRWAVDQGLADAALRRDVEAIVARMPQLLSGRAETTSLLHGDLWSGNYLADASGRPVILDPAVYYGCRETEFGMIQLFGGCGQAFYDAYQQAWPMPEGWRRRVEVYVLYHLLNHLNLFGTSYAAQCRRTAAAIGRA